MAVKLKVGKKPVPKAPAYGKNSFYAPVKPKPPAIVKPRLPAGMTINRGQSDAAREAGLQGGGAWGTYSQPTVDALDTGWGGTSQIAAVGGSKGRPKFGDYIAEGIPGDWEVEDAEAAFASRMAGLRAGFQGNLRKALIDMGLTDQGKLGKFGSYIDADTIQQAAANKYSTSAQIAQQEEVSRSKSEAALAARGMLSSGQTTKNAEDIAAEGEKGRYAALQQFLGAGEEGLTGIANQEAGLLADVAKARSSAAARLAAQYGWDFPDEEEETATAGGTTGGGTTVTTGGRKPTPKPPLKYNPKGYVPGGSTAKVAKAIVKKATPKAPAKKKK